MFDRVIVPIKLVAAEAGFLPPGPCMLFADMMEAKWAGLSSGQRIAERVEKGRGVINGKREGKSFQVVGSHHVHK